MNWIILIVAGLFEIGWAVGLKSTEGFTRLWPSVFTAASMLVSIALLGVAMKTLPLGTAYAVWVGIGIAGTAIVGALWGAESLNWGSALSLLLILTGVLGLKMASSG